MASLHQKHACDTNMIHTPHAGSFTGKRNEHARRAPRSAFGAGRGCGFICYLMEVILIIIVMIITIIIIIILLLLLLVSMYDQLVHSIQIYIYTYIYIYMYIAGGGTNGLPRLKYLLSLALFVRVFSRGARAR